MAGSGIVTPYNAGNTADPPVDDVVIQSIESTPEATTQMIFDGLHTKTGHLFRLVLRDHNIRAALIKIIDGDFDDAFGVFHSMMFIKLDVQHIVLLHLGHGVGGDQFGMETLGHVGQILHDALNIHDHGVAGAGNNGQLLL